MMSEYYTRSFNDDGTEKHIYKEGARYHVIRYDSEFGMRCSEPNCEMNKKNTLKFKKRSL